MIADPVVTAFMSTMEIDAEDCKNVFNFLDLDHEGFITFEEFLQGLKSVRGQAKRIDVATLPKITRKIDSKLNTIFPQVDPKSCPLRAARATRANLDSSMSD